MKKIHSLTLIILCLLFISCGNPSQVNSQTHSSKNEHSALSQDSIIEQYYNKGAKQYSYLTKEYMEWIDKGLEQDTTIAFLWQRKALPYWKIRKYEVALKHYNKAVHYNRARYLSRRGFLKCIFMKAYESALEDFHQYEKEYGITYENDHSTTFYKTLCYLSLNRFDEALNTLLPEVQQNMTKSGDDAVHFVDFFYLGITYYELNEYEKAIQYFDKSLAQYENFSDVKYWKALSLFKLKDYEKGLKILKEGQKDYQNGDTFNEDSSFYELYPYQVTWEWDFIVNRWSNIIANKRKQDKG